MIARPAALTLILLSFLAAVSCSPTDPTPFEGAVFRIGACGDQHFNVLIRDPAVIREAEGLVGNPRQRIVNAELRRGSGGFNQPWGWHLDPDTVGFAELTIELCDGCPRMIQDDLDYWIDTVGRFCPWTTRVLERLR